MADPTKQAAVGGEDGIKQAPAKPTTAMAPAAGAPGTTTISRPPSVGRYAVPARYAPKPVATTPKPAPAPAAPPAPLLPPSVTSTSTMAQQAYTPPDLNVEGGPLPSRPLYDVAGARAAYSNAERRNLPGALDVQHTATASVTGDPELYSPDEILEAQEPSWYESIYRWMEPFDTPRRAVWYAVELAGKALPDAAPETVQYGDINNFSDSLQWLGGKVLGSMIETAGEGFSAGNLGPMGSLGEVVEYAQGKADEDAVYEALGQNLYRALSTGELAERAEKVPGRWVWGSDWQGPNPRGFHLVDAIFPQDQMQALLASDDPNVATLAGWASDPVGRELLGAALEVAIDPLWFAGPAKGTQAVAKGSEVYHVAQPLMRAAGVLEHVGINGAMVHADEAQKVVLAAVEGVGTASEATKARKVLREAADVVEMAGLEAAYNAERAAQAAKQGGATAQAEAVRLLLEEQQRFAAVAKAATVAEHTEKAVAATREAQRILGLAHKAGQDAKVAIQVLERQAQVYGATARTAEAQTTVLRNAVAMAEKAQGAVREGWGALSVPFGETTRFLIGADAAARAKKLTPAVLVAGADKVANALKPYSAAEVLAKVDAIVATGRTAEEAMGMLSAGERAAAAAQIALGKTLNWPRFLLTKVNEVVGTRYFQPLAVRISSPALAADLQAKGIPVTRIMGNNWIAKARQVAPELWANYQSAVSRYFASMESLEGKLRVDVRALTDQAALVARTRKRLTKSEIPKVEKQIAQAQGAGASTRTIEKLQERLDELKRWTEDSYDATAVLTEAGTLIEQGSGVLRSRPELGPLVGEVKKLVEQTAAALGKDYAEIGNALAKMARFARGDKAQYEAYIAQMDNLKRLWVQIGVREQGVVGVIQAAGHQRLAQVRAARQLVAQVGVDKLADALLQIRAVAEGKPLTELKWDVLKAPLEQALGADLAAQVMKKAAIAMGDQDGAKALLMLANVVANDADAILQGLKAAGAQGNKSPHAAFAEVLRDLMKRWGDEASDLRKAAEGAIDPGKVLVVNGTPIASGMDLGTFRKMIRWLAERERATARSLAGEARWATMTKEVVDGPLDEAAAALERSRLLRRVADLVEEVRAEKAFAAQNRAGRLPKWITPGDLPEKEAELFARGEDAARSAERLRLLREAEAVQAKADAAAGIPSSLGSAEDLLLRRVARATEGASPAQAEALVEQALYELLGVVKGRSPGLDHAVSAMAKRMAPKLGGNKADLLQGARDLRAAGQAELGNMADLIKADTQAQVDFARGVANDLRTEVKRQFGEAKAGAAAVRPEIPLPDVDLSKPDAWRPLQEWESKLWDDFKQIAPHLSVRETMLLAYGALDELPNVIQDKAMLARLRAAYPAQVMGRRLGKLPLDMENVVERLRGIVKGYEELYAKYGEEFMKSPEEMLKLWGVVDYVPHLAIEESFLSRGGAARALGYMQERAQQVKGGGRSVRTSGLEEAFAMRMDARRMRAIDGTIAEVNALREHSALVLSLDPSAILARYSQANKTMSAREMLYGMLKGGVFQAVRAEKRADGTMKPLAEVALERDLVPLVARRVAGIEDEILRVGTIQDWRAAGIRPQDILAALRRPDDAEPLLATVLKETPELGLLRTVDDFLLELRAREYAGGQPALSDVPAMIAQGMSFEDIAKSLNQTAQKVGLLDRKVDAAGLRWYFEGGEPAWRLYVPRVVQESMVELFKPNVLEGSLLYQGFSAVNAFFKTRLTVMAMAFSTRNALSNLSTMISDVGLAALRPTTHAKATILSSAVHYAEPFGGSLARAADYFASPLPPDVVQGMAPAVRAAAEAAHKARNLAFQGMFGRLLKNGVDLGDGVIRSADEALALLRENQVTSQAFTSFVDVGRHESDILELIASGKGRGAKALQALSALEDAVVVMLPSLMSGGALPGLAVSKRFGGEVVARSIENQSRIALFVENLRTSGSVGYASEKVQKFLFDYGDLTATQKSVMRLIFPFFTWNVKNMHLQAELAQKSPYLYSSFFRFFQDGVPRALTAWQAENTGQPYIPPQPGSDETLAAQEPHRLTSVSIPFPWMEDTRIVGLGLPQEAFAEKAALLFGLAEAPFAPPAREYDDRKRYLRIVSEMNFILKMLVEWTTGHHVYYDRPISELTNGQLIAQVLAAVEAIPGYGPPMRAALAEMAGLSITNELDRKSGVFRDVPTVSGYANWQFANLPWTRIVRDVSAVTNVYAMSATAMSAAGLEEVPLALRLLDAYSGIHVVQENPVTAEVARQVNLEQALQRNQEARGAVKQYEVSNIPKR